MERGCEQIIDTNFLRPSVNRVLAIALAIGSVPLAASGLNRPNRQDRASYSGCYAVLVQPSIKRTELWTVCAGRRTLVLASPPVNDFAIDPVRGYLVLALPASVILEPLYDGQPRSIPAGKPDWPPVVQYTCGTVLYADSYPPRDAFTGKALRLGGYETFRCSANRLRVVGYVKEEGGPGSLISQGVPPRRIYNDIFHDGQPAASAGFDVSPNGVYLATDLIVMGGSGSTELCVQAGERPVRCYLSSFLDPRISPQTYLQPWVMSVSDDGEVSYMAVDPSAPSPRSKCVAGQLGCYEHDTYCSNTYWAWDGIVIMNSVDDTGSFEKQAKKLQFVSKATADALIAWGARNGHGLPSSRPNERRH